MTVDHPQAALVYSAAYRLNVTRTTREDLIGAGFLGLAEAEAKFDPSKRVPFEPFAKRFIRWRIVDEIRRACGRYACECGHVIGRGFMRLIHCPRCGCDLREPTAGELKALELVAKGYTNVQIAGEMGTTIKTVKTYLQGICAKLELPEGNRRVQMANYWWRRNGMAKEAVCA